MNEIDKFESKLILFSSGKTCEEGSWGGEGSRGRGTSKRNGRGRRKKKGRDWMARGKEKERRRRKEETWGKWWLRVGWGGNDIINPVDNEMTTELINVRRTLFFEISNCWFHCSLREIYIFQIGFLFYKINSASFQKISFEMINSNFNYFSLHGYLLLLLIPLIVDFFVEHL